MLNSCTLTPVDKTQPPVQLVSRIKDYPAFSHIKTTIRAFKHNSFEPIQGQLLDKIIEADSYTTQCNKEYSEQLAGDLKDTMLVMPINSRKRAYLLDYSDIMNPFTTLIKFDK